MANKILIVHGYSDGAQSFTILRDFLVNNELYQRQNVAYVSYASLEDAANFEDFSDKLDEDYARLYDQERIDVACHSTGSLVVRAWLWMRLKRQLENGQQPISPVEHLLSFAPANFGSDIALLGQSFLQKFRMTFSPNERPGDTFQSGKIVLEDLEPASPFQWGLSVDDLHGETYFTPSLPPECACYPFIFAAGNRPTGIVAELVHGQRKSGTDGTVRICGTSLNTRKCNVNFSKKEVAPVWQPETKFPNIPYSVFNGFNHSTLVQTDLPAFGAADGPAGLLKKALSVKTHADFATVAQEFQSTSERNYQAIKAADSDEAKPFQQFFFRVSDDTGIEVTDYFIDFHVLKPDNSVDADLTKLFDSTFNADVYTHSVNTACRVMMIDCGNLESFFKNIVAAKGKVVFDITGCSSVPNVDFVQGHCVVFDGANPIKPGPSFLYPNTTTLVEVTLVRKESDELLRLLDSDLNPVAYLSKAKVAPPEPTGRARLLTQQ
jgi:hypothetical protein